MKSLAFSTLWILLALSAVAAQSDRRWVRHPDHGFDIWVSGTDHEHRAATRLFYWSSGRSRGEISIGYGPADWDDKHLEGMENLRYGYTWRMASGFWSVLDTNMGLRLGGQSIAPGSYYLGLSRSLDGKQWSLAVLDPAVIRRVRIDAFETHIRPIPSRFDIPLEFEQVEETEPHLKIRLDAHEDDPQGGSLAIAFGPYRLSAELKLDSMPQNGDWPRPAHPALAGSGHAIDGAWTSKVAFRPDRSWELAMNFGKQEGVMVGTVDIPLRDIYGLYLADLEIDGTKVRFRVPVNRQIVTFEGRIDSGRLLGTFQVDDRKVEAEFRRP